MGSSRRKRYRKPKWPTWVYATFNARGLELLEAAYAHLKDRSDLDRASRISAEDLASSILTHLRVTGDRACLRRGSSSIRIAV